MPKPDLILASRRIITPTGERDGAILINAGRITAVVPRTDIPANQPVEDHADLPILPGLVDPHVHVNEPGRTHWEGFDTATRAAAAGGVTTFADMPLNATPVTTTLNALTQKLISAAGKLHVDVAFHAGLIPGNLDQIEPLIDVGVVGVKAFLTHSGIDEFPNATEAELRAAMPLLARRNVPLLAHAELDGPAPASAGRSYAAYLASRPRDWENRAVRLLIALCREYRCPVHIVHLSSGDVIDDLRAAKADGLPLTIETCPHYLCFDSSQIPDGDTRFKCAPPIREAENRQRLWAALADGTIDLIASDHSPCPPEMKRLADGDFAAAWGGIASLQLGLSAVWTEASRRGFTLADVARWMAAAPARLLGLGSKGAIAPGADADLVIFDPNARWTVYGDALFHRHKLTPYEKMEVAGRVRSTYLRGRKIFDAGRIIEPLAGQTLFRE